MNTPTLPQNDDPQQQADRAKQLEWAKERYAWAHSHTYDVDGESLVLEPISVLKVDDDHPFPSSQNPTLVQLAELLNIGIALVDNILIKLTNELDVGAVKLDPPPPSEESEGFVGRVKTGVEDAVKLVTQGVAEATKLTAEVSEGAAEVVHGMAKMVEEVADGVKDRVTEPPPKDDIKALLDTLEGIRQEGHALRTRAHGIISEDGGIDNPLSGELTSALGDLIKRLLEELLASLLASAGLYGPAESLRDFAQQFQTIVVPDVIASTLSDALFARMRVAGPNPLLIAKVKDRLPENFPVDPKRFKELTGQDLPDAISNQRVYLVDYVALTDAVGGDFPAGQKYLSAPLALFALETDKNDLRPVAIQCNQEPGNSNPVFYRDDGESWELAKNHVQCADGNYHELISHLGLTHLLVESFVVATHRNLAETHPVFLLLLPHFQGTLFINNAAIASLINPQGTVDMLLAGTIQSDWKMTIDSLENLDFNKHMLSEDLETRGVMDPAVFPNYPYRDDALLVWNAIETWVQDYLNIYYNSDADVAADTELKAWYQDLISKEGGRVSGLGETGPDGETGIFTVAYLTKVLTMVIFTGSAQHASVNFPQHYIMSYTPAMPLALYSPAPTVVGGELGPKNTLEALPPLQIGLLQLLVGQLLGGVYFTRLGEYDRHQKEPWFKDARVAAPLEVFQNNLTGVEKEIGARNLARPEYKPLLPSRIPQSINI